MLSGSASRRPAVGGCSPILTCATHASVLRRRALKVRAAKEGITLSAYLLREFAQLAERPTLEELMELARHRKPSKPFTEDAVVVDFLIDASAAGEAGRERLARERWPWAALELMDAEVAQVVCRHVLRGELASVAAEAALADLVMMRIERHSHLPLVQRAFELRDNATIYDALYLALAEILGATLLTRDAALARVPGVNAAVEVIPAG